MGIDKELKGQMIKEIKRRVIKILGAFTIIFILYLVVMLNWIKTLEAEQVKEKSEKIVEIIAE
jgi:Sec-independent protein secretion pathway component TatC